MHRGPDTAAQAPQSRSVYDQRLQRPLTDSSYNNSADTPSTTAPTRSTGEYSSAFVLQRDCAPVRRDLSYASESSDRDSGNDRGCYNKDTGGASGSGYDSDSGSDCGHGEIFIDSETLEAAGGDIVDIVCADFNMSRADSEV
ncbi:hypothetical protein PHYPSEUDO_010361 [Phytophthora pseudosyringae]|uniref:Uncharacterized protein n=1 Tax=Phytophthora pseudosyringae TaxID=221518 RepID=A0A8T1W837_9STRA|nr:hypothetical protein PHYPSEUDO_010361 [Phytophthora pseudosyringae]